MTQEHSQPSPDPDRLIHFGSSADPDESQPCNLAIRRHTDRCFHAVEEIVPEGYIVQGILIPHEDVADITPPEVTPGTPQNGNPPEREPPRKLPRKSPSEVIQETARGSHGSTTNPGIAESEV